MAKARPKRPDKEQAPSHLRLVHELNTLHALATWTAGHVREASLERSKAFDDAVDFRNRQLRMPGLDRSQILALMDEPIQARPDCAARIELITQELEQIAEHARLALQAVMEGGAALLDETDSPGRRQWTVDITAKVRAVEGLIAVLRNSLCTPRVVFIERADQLRDLGVWFGSTRDRLCAAMEVDAISTGRPLRLDDEEFSDLEKNCMIALRRGEHTDTSSRIRLDDLSKRIGCGNPASGNFRAAVAGLVRRGLVASKAGRGGGVWLSSKGKSHAEWHAKRS